MSLWRNNMESQVIKSDQNDGASQVFQDNESAEWLVLAVDDDPLYRKTTGFAL